MLSDEGLNDIVPPAIDLSILMFYAYALCPLIINYQLEWKDKHFAFTCFTYIDLYT